MTTLNNSFCRPTNEVLCQIMTPLPISADENHVLIAFTVNGKNYKFYRRWEDVKDDNRTEIPVTRFLDLLHDKIVRWRLEEVGFSEWINLSCVYESEVGNGKKLRVYCDQNQLSVSMDVESDGVVFHITTFTDLMTLIRMLTPPTEKP